jgi:hypothetical protein
VFKKKGCGCEQYASELNRRGNQWCREHRQEIIDNIHQRAKKRFGNVLPFAERVIGHWVDRAIDATESPIEADPNWFAAITTAPRQEPTLRDCISSLRLADWEPVVFAEPGSVETNCQAINHPQTRGVWHNWLSAARAGLDSGASMILTVQDDVVLHPETKQLAERWLPETGGVLSLYTSAKYSRGRDLGVNRINTGSFWGACAFAWTAEALREALSTKVAREWLGCRVRTKSANARIMERRRNDPSLIANSDVAIGRAVKQTKRPIYTVDPSPAMHIARHSTQRRGDNTGNRNCSRCADHLLPLVPQVFPSPVRSRLNHADNVTRESEQQS